MTPPKILPPHYFVLSLVLMIGLGMLGQTVLLPTPWQYAGLIFWAVGLWLGVQGSRGFAKAGTNIIPFTESTTLVTEGVFAISRNPMYTGFILALVGTAVLMNGWIAWLVIVPFIAIIRSYFIKNEERLMTETFGDAYVAYCASVRRWL
jgi:protein-S-isoprenylcysteine O-methyltransferase Ste14